MRNWPCQGCPPFSRTVPLQCKSHQSTSPPKARRQMSAAASIPRDSPCDQLQPFLSLHLTEVSALPMGTQAPPCRYPPAGHRPTCCIRLGAVVGLLALQFAAAAAPGRLEQGTAPGQHIHRGAFVPCFPVLARSAQVKVPLSRLLPQH